MSLDRGCPDPRSVAQRAKDLDTLRLVRRYQAGEDGAFDEIHRRYHEDVMRSVRAVLGDHHEAQDVAQEAFSVAFRALRDEFDPDHGAPFRSWLLRVAVNAAVDRYRHRRHVAPMDPAALVVLCDESTARIAGLEVTAAWLTDPQIQAEVERLPAREQQVLLLRCLGCYSHGEIAEILGLTEAASRQVWRRALRTVRERLAPRSGAGHATLTMSVASISVGPARVCTTRRLALACASRPRRHWGWAR